MTELLGQSVKFMRPTGAQATVVDTIVIGSEPRTEGEAEKLHLAFLRDNAADVLSGSGWREAFDRALGVSHVSDQAAEARGRYWYQLAAANEAAKPESESAPKARRPRSE